MSFLVVSKKNRKGFNEMRKFAVAALVLFGIQSVIAEACQYAVPTLEERAAQVDTIISGNVVDVEPLSGPLDVSDQWVGKVDTAIKVRVSEVFKGDVKKGDVLLLHFKDGSKLKGGGRRGCPPGAYFFRKSKEYSGDYLFFAKKSGALLYTDSTLGNSMLKFLDAKDDVETLRYLRRNKKFKQVNGYSK